MKYIGNFGVIVLCLAVNVAQADSVYPNLVGQSCSAVVAFRDAHNLTGVTIISDTPIVRRELTGQCIEQRTSVEVSGHGPAAGVPIDFSLEFNASCQTYIDYFSIGVWNGAGCVLF